ncbi:MAG: hypothetical protein JXD22_03475 [Sedimentisphaerales bacterium]|nr:hypothetical protein [Sedimentisphaerales bacterium]
MLQTKLANVEKCMFVVFLLSFSSVAMAQTKKSTYNTWNASGKYPCVTWEKFQSSGPDLEQIGFIAVKHAKDIKASNWSVGCETLDRDQAVFSVYKDFVGELGAKHARLQSGWAKCEKEKGIYTFEWLDEHVYGLKEQGVAPWICLCYGNPIYGSEIKLFSGLAPITDSPEAMAAWLKYVETTVTRYKDVVKKWNIWNEPSHKDHQENEYAKLLVATAQVIRRIQPDSVILAEWQHIREKSLVNSTKVLEYLKKENKLDLVDYWTYHPYLRNPDACYAKVEEYQKRVQSYNPKYKMLQGESGCPSILEWGHALRNYPWTEFSQAKWVLRRMAGDVARDIPSSIFTIIDLKYPNMLQSFGLLRANLLHEIIYKRPSYYAYQHMAGFFDCTVKPIGLLEYESDSSRKMEVAGFSKENKPIALIWYNDEIPGDDIKWDMVSLTIKNMEFHDPVYVEMITGKVYEIEKSDIKTKEKNSEFTQLPVWDSPIMIAERSLVQLRKEK